MENILAECYGIGGANIFKVQGGFCADAFKISLNDKAYFLKRYDKKRPVAEKYSKLIDVYAPILCYLSETNMSDCVPKSILTTDGKNFCEDSNYKYLLYEYIDGTTIAEDKLTKLQTLKLGKIVGMLHSALYPKGEIPKSLYEDFSIEFNDKLSEFIYSDINEHQFLNPYISELKKLTKITTTLSEKAKICNAPYVLCHTDIHNWNLIQTDEDLILIDWEGIKYAPKEADFFALTNIPYKEDFINEYRKYNAAYELNQTILDFYNCRRKSEDIWEFIEKLLYENLSHEEKTVTIDCIVEECCSIAYLL